MEEMTGWAVRDATVKLVLHEQTKYSEKNTLFMKYA